MSRFREILASKKRCLIVALLAYSIAIILAVGLFGRHMTSVKLMLPMSWAINEPMKPQTKYFDEEVTFSVSGANKPASIAVGGGITSKGVANLTGDNMVTKMSLFTTFIPSFCETASPHFNYHFYFAYDQSDPKFTNDEFLSAFESNFKRSFYQSCTSSITVFLRTVLCNHNHKPTWAQNDAMLEAYLNGVEYYYRINDDTRMITKNWGERFIEVLGAYVPINVGVVGPKHLGGNTLILTYDFVHRTHIDIFGFYYPRLFTDWWGDDWITKVYRPYRSTKHDAVYLEHTLGMRRYEVSREVVRKLDPRLEKDKETLRRYINYTSTKDSIKVDGRKVISMSLFGNNPKYNWGAIRNAQLAPILFPGWKLRVYVTPRNSKAAGVKSLLVPERILRKLKQLGAAIFYVRATSIAPVFWRYLVIDDESVDFFIVRNAQSRLNERDAIVVNDWLNNQHLDSDANSLHCIRDHPDHANRSIVDGLWGGKRRSIQKLLNTTIASALEGFRNSTVSFKNSKPSTFLESVIWPVLSFYSYCHDSISCDKRSSISGYKTDGFSGEYIGQEFDEHEESNSTYFASRICLRNVSFDLVRGQSL